MVSRAISVAYWKSLKRKINKLKQKRKKIKYIAEKIDEGEIDLIDELQSTGKGRYLKLLELIKQETDKNKKGKNI